MSVYFRVAVIYSPTGLIVNMATITDHQTNHSTLMVTNTK